jgi:hypothetical protein
MSASQMGSWDSRAGSRRGRDAIEILAERPDSTWLSGPLQAIAGLVFYEYDFEARYLTVAARDAET